MFSYLILRKKTGVTIRISPVFPGPVMFLFDYPSTPPKQVIKQQGMGRTCKNCKKRLQSLKTHLDLLRLLRKNIKQCLPPRFLCNWLFNGFTNTGRRWMRSPSWRIPSSLVFRRPSVWWFFDFFWSPLRRCWTHQLGCDLGYFGHYMLERPHHMGDVLPSPGASIAYVYIQCLCIFDYP